MTSSAARDEPMLRLIVIGDRKPAHITHREIDAVIGLLPNDIEAGWVATDSSAARDLAGVDGVWLVSGGPYKDDDAVLAAIDYCIDSGTPFLGTCSGFQYACIAVVRRQGLEAIHSEAEPDAADPIIARLACSLYSEERLVVPVAGTRLASICGSEPFLGFHYCGFGLATKHEQTIERCGAVISAHADDAGVEAIELPHHPFFLATAFQPQVGASETGRLHPLLRSLLGSARASKMDAAARVHQP